MLSDNSRKSPFRLRRALYTVLLQPARIRLVEAVACLQRLRREMGRLSEMDEDYKKKKLALEVVIKKLKWSLRRRCSTGQLGTGSYTIVQSDRSRIALALSFEQLLAPSPLGIIRSESPQPSDRFRVYADGVTEGENAEEKVLVGHIM